MLYDIVAESITCYATNPFSPTEYVLQNCVGKCLPNKCDSCTAVNSSMGITYECSSFANPTVAALSLSQDECKDVSNELNNQVQMELIKPLQSQKELFPQMAEHIDQAMEDIKLLRLFKFCICATNGCNDPEKNLLDSSNNGGDDLDSSSGSARNREKLIPFFIATSILMNIAM